MLKREKRRRLEPVGGLIGDVISKLGLTAQLTEYRAVELWTETVGVTVANHAQADWIELGVLVVRVDSPAWIQELTFLKPDIIARLNERMGQALVKDIRFLLRGRRLT